MEVINQKFQNGNAKMVEEGKIPEATFTGTVIDSEGCAVATISRDTFKDVFESAIELVEQNEMFRPSHCPD